MPPRRRTVDPEELAAARAAHAAGTASRAETGLLVRFLLARLEEVTPGRSVEVRVPPFGAVQVVSGVRHTRGTPPAVVEMDAATWIALALGELGWAEAESTGRVRASGQRADLSPYLPLEST